MHASTQSSSSREPEGSVAAVAGVLGTERTLQLLTEPLAAVSAQVASGGAFDWPTAEAALYCVRAVHRCFPLLTQLDSDIAQPSCM